jgi:hypothetical protein
VDWGTDGIRVTEKGSWAKLDINLIDPGKCQTNFERWAHSWHIAFVNKFHPGPIVYVISQDVDVEYVLFEDKEEQHMYQMPLSAENFNRDIKLVYNMLKAACVNQDYVKAANGRKAWQALVAQSYDDGTGELNKHIHCALALV